MKFLSRLGLNKTSQLAFWAFVQFATPAHSLESRPSSTAFYNAYEQLQIKPKLRNFSHDEPPLPLEIILQISSASRFRAKLLKIDHDSIEVQKNRLFFKMNADACLQETIELKTSFLSRTLCIRDHFVLMDFIFKYQK